MDPLFVWGLPGGALIIGAVALAISWLESRAFDRRYPKSKSEGPSARSAKHHPA